MNKDEFAYLVQLKWETKGNVTQAHEELIECCFEEMCALFGDKEVAQLEVLIE